MCDADLYYWQRTRGWSLEPFECNLLIKLSRAFVAAQNEGKYPSTRSPYVSDDEGVKQKKRDVLAKIIDRATR